MDSGCSDIPIFQRKRDAEKDFYQSGNHIGNDRNVVIFVFRQTAVCYFGNDKINREYDDSSHCVGYAGIFECGSLAFSKEVTTGSFAMAQSGVIKNNWRFNTI
jgi:hypothetical protein